MGAFLKRPEQAATEAAVLDAVDKAGTEGGKPDAANHLYETGTFAQVHTIITGDTPDSAQLLLLGHRRIRRNNTVSLQH